MNAIYVLLTWLMSLGSPQAPAQMTSGVSLQPSATQSGFMAPSPRTVVALEDTHFRPSK